MSRAGLEKKPGQVAAMFDAVAERYDRTNTILSAGQDVRWRRHSVRALQLLPGQKVLDVAAGTGVSTKALSATGAWCVATDFSIGMYVTGGEHLARAVLRRPGPHAARKARRRGRAPAG